MEMAEIPRFSGEQINYFPFRYSPPGNRVALRSLYQEQDTVTSNMVRSGALREQIDHLTRTTLTPYIRSYELAANRFLTKLAVPYFTPPPKNDWYSYALTGPLGESTHVVPFSGTEVQAIVDTGTTLNLIGSLGDSHGEIEGDALANTFYEQSRRFFPQLNGERGSHTGLLDRPLAVWNIFAVARNAEDMQFHYGEQAPEGLDSFTFLPDQLVRWDNRL
jgi:hypothetical protein